MTNQCQPRKVSSFLGTEAPLLASFYDNPLGIPPKSSGANGKPVTEGRFKTMPSKSPASPGLPTLALILFSILVLTPLDPSKNVCDSRGSKLRRT